MDVQESGVAAARCHIAKLPASLQGTEHGWISSRNTRAIGALKRTQEALDQLRIIVTLQIAVLIAVAFLWSRFG